MKWRGVWDPESDVFMMLFTGPDTGIRDSELLTGGGGPNLTWDTPGMLGALTPMLPAPILVLELWLGIMESVCDL